jgi:hypothetical protein
MARVTPQELIEMLEEAQLEPSSYSGRGMYGKECIAVTNESVWRVARALPQDADIPAPATDQLGKGIVMYWPTLEWPQEKQ